MNPGVPAALAASKGADSTVAHGGLHGAPADNPGSTPISSRQALHYGLLGLPLAFVALPLYVVLPNHYARELGVPLASLGALLLGARLFDAVVDPWLGRVSDRLFAHRAARLLRVCQLCAVLLALGFVALFFPPVRGRALLAWALAALLVTYTAFSMVSVSYQSWGARLGGNALQRSRIVAWREGLGLVGVLVASILPVALGLAVSTAVFVALLAVGMAAWTTSKPPVTSAPTLPSAQPPLWLPFTRPGFRGLLAVFVLNGIASAIPATLVLFFIQDRLQAPAQWEGVFLLVYFLTAAASMPLWLRAIARFGLWPTWLAGMLLAVLVFIGAASLGAADMVPFLLVCALSGLALGSDLAVPPALLAGMIQANGDHGSNEGSYFGWWNFATKLNLALAAGLALPVLQWFGYTPGARSASALQALVIAYCVIPCALKLVAAYTLFYWARANKHS